MKVRGGILIILLRSHNFKVPTQQQYLLNDIFVIITPAITPLVASSQRFRPWQVGRKKEMKISSAKLKLKPAYICYTSGI